MDRFVVREPKVGLDYPQENQMIPFLTNPGNNRNIVSETMYFGGYGAEFPVHRSPGFMAVTHVNASHFAPNTGPGANQAMSGIDPRYLAAYADNSHGYITGHMQQMERGQTAYPNGPAFASDYGNRRFVGADRSKPITFKAQVATSSNNVMMTPPPLRENSSKSLPQSKNTVNERQNSQQNQIYTASKVQTTTKSFAKENEAQKAPSNFPVLKTRSERLQDLHKTGARVFSGPVEKVLKWHKALQELGLLVFYEIVAKCVSVRNEDSCGKALVVRDESGPAMQVVYYEIDFLLPELRPPCTVRVIGRMMPGTCRLQAFNVRPATGDDVSTLPRRAAVAAHHVSKLCKEFGNP